MKTLLAFVFVLVAVPASAQEGIQTWFGQSASVDATEVFADGAQLMPIEVEPSRPGRELLRVTTWYAWRGEEYLWTEVRAQLVNPSTGCVEQMPVFAIGATAVTVFDYNGDGREDIMFTVPDGDKTTVKLFPVTGFFGCK